MKVVAEGNVPTSQLGSMYVEAAKELGFQYERVELAGEYVCTEPELDIPILCLEDLFSLAESFTALEVRAYPEAVVLLKFEE
jgi:hypothetical protein